MDIISLPGERLQPRAKSSQADLRPGPKEDKTLRGEGRAGTWSGPWGQLSPTEPAGSQLRQTRVAILPLLFDPGEFTKSFPGWRLSFLVCKMGSMPHMVWAGKSRSHVSGRAHLGVCSEQHLSVLEGLSPEWGAEETGAGHTRCTPLSCHFL